MVCAGSGSRKRQIAECRYGHNKWWYDTFSKGESIIIADIEDIKEEHRMPYDMLKAQNVRNVVVCPLRYKDEISGFFGVDNPPKGDYRGLLFFWI
mgnify:CR=1 FL=1